MTGRVRVLSCKQKDGREPSITELQGLAAHPWASDFHYYQPCLILSASKLI